MRTLTRERAPSRGRRRPYAARALVFLLVGAALAVSIGLLVATIAVLAGQGLPAWARVGVVTVAALAIPVALAFLPQLRPVQVYVAEQLLGVAVPGGRPGPAVTGGDRTRAATWFVLHVLAGAVLVVDVVALLPAAVTLLLGRGTDGTDERSVAPAWAHDAVDGLGGWSPVAGVLLLLAVVVLPVLLVRVLRAAGPVLLGPSAAQRLAQVEAEAARLGARTRLARELHDSVGHAMSIVVLQASAAGDRLRHGDVPSATQAIEAIETTARAATAELDHVLGLLRDERTGAPVEAPTLQLDSLRLLLEAFRRAGLGVDVAIGADLGGLPPLLGREAYRIVQECLTNALRHASEPSAQLRLDRRSGELTIAVANPARGARRRQRGHGLTGVAERARALGGTSEVTVEAGSWTVLTRLPLPGR